jgi:hypothetical protein
MKKKKGQSKEHKYFADISVRVTITDTEFQEENLLFIHNNILALIFYLKAMNNIS